MAYFGGYLIVLKSGASIRFITQGAEDIYDIAQMKYKLYGDGRDELVNELTPPEQPAQQPTEAQKTPEIIEPVTTAIEEGFNRVAPKEQPFYRPGKEPEFEGLFHWDEKRLPNGDIQYKSFDPVGQTKKFWDNLFSANTGNNQMNQDMVNELRSNTAATRQMTETIRQASGSSPAMFA